MVAHIDLTTSALAPGLSPVRVCLRDAGARLALSAVEGPPIVMLHGGWGYEIYPFDRQIAALAGTHRLVAPDRTGYGRSGRLARQATDFHHRAAAETFAVIDALGLDRPVVWGHSDGAVIALLMGLAGPDRLSGLIVEAAHFLRRKPGSREFFEAMLRDPDSLGERVTGVLARDHGEGWRDVLHYQERLGAGTTGMSASPVAGDGKIYCSSEEGEVYVIAAGPEFKKLTMNRFEYPLMATPAISEGRIYFRTLESLIAVG